MLFREDMRSRTLAAALGLLVFGTSLPASAQPAPAGAYPAACAAASVSTAKSDEAHAFYSAGRALYDEANYDAALTQFRESYKRDCSKHELLVIISRSYELKGDRAEAVRALEVFLDRVKDSPDAGTHRTKIENLKKQIAAQPPPPVAAPPQVVREHTIPPWILVGAGGAALITGTILLVTAPAQPPSCSTSSGLCALKEPDGRDISVEQQSKNQDRATAAAAMRTWGYITVIGGPGLIAGGLLWHFLEPTGPVASSGSIKPKLTPAVAPGYAGMTLGGTF